MTSFCHVLFKINPLDYELDNLTGNTASPVSVSKGKDMVLLPQIWSTFVTVLWNQNSWLGWDIGSYESQFPNFADNFDSFLQNYTFKSSSNFYPIDITWRKIMHLFKNFNLNQFMVYWYALNFWHHRINK